MGTPSSICYHHLPLLGLVYQNNTELCAQETVKCGKEQGSKRWDAFGFSLFETLILHQGLRLNMLSRVSPPLLGPSWSFCSFTLWQVTHRDNSAEVSRDRGCKEEQTHQIQRSCNEVTCPSQNLFVPKTFFCSLPGLSFYSFVLFTEASDNRI